MVHGGISNERNYDVPIYKGSLSYPLLMEIYVFLTRFFLYEHLLQNDIVDLTYWFISSLSLSLFFFSENKNLHLFQYELY
jgi:hypothetical protein